MLINQLKRGIKIKKRYKFYKKPPKIIIKE
jgi:hypothetical protein